MTSSINLGRLVSACNGIEGRKKIQKIVYLIQQAGFQSDFPYSYGYHHYGPYSSGVRHDLDVLVRESLVVESEKDTGDFVAYNYRVSDEFEKGLSEVAAVNDSGWVPIARKLGQYPARDLEAASTVLFLSRKGLSGGKLREKFVSLKPSLVQKFDDAVKVLAEVGVAVEV